MRVIVNNRAYRMSWKEYEGLRQIASEQVTFGVYAVEKAGYAELRCDRCKSRTQLKALIRGFRRQGFEVRANNGTVKPAARNEELTDAAG